MSKRIDRLLDTDFFKGQLHNIWQSLESIGIVEHKQNESA